MEQIILEKQIFAQLVKTFLAIMHPDSLLVFTCPIQ
jgi:hypothetical protein